VMLSVNVPYETIFVYYFDPRKLYPALITCSIDKLPISSGARRKFRTMFYK
jgi:hypothetical protein